MIISNEHKYIFIAVPKTGTSSISLFLLENDPSAKRNELLVNGKKIQVPEHITAYKLKNIMGKSYDEYTKICFIRDPFSKVISSYFFYKKGRAATKVAAGERRKLKVRLTIMLTNRIPFPLWAIFYPYRTSSHFIKSPEGKLLVDYIGCFERLCEDFNDIFQSIGLDFKDQQMKTRNITEYDRKNSYFTNPIVRKIVSAKIKEDLELFKTVGCSLTTGSAYRNSEEIGSNT